MEIFDADTAWLSALDLNLGPQATALPRGEVLRCGVERVPELDWAILHLLPPHRQALWFVQTYAALERSLQRAFFSWHPDTGEDLDRRRRFEGVLRRRKIPFKSHKAWWAFGLYPRLWGARFRPAQVDPRWFRRYLSIAAPSSSTDALLAHLSAQAAQFGEQACASVDEDSLLFNLTLPNDGGLHHRLLLSGPSVMTEAEIEAQLLAWERILGSDGEFQGFVQAMPTELKFAGPIYAQAPSPVPERAADLLSARIRFACRLGWPHMLDALRQQLAGMADGPQRARWLDEVDLASARYPVIAEDPLRTLIG